MFRFLAFGVGLDPRQGQLFGPKFGPSLVGACLGIMTFAGVGLAPGFPGMGMNPARCFAFAVARADFERESPRFSFQLRVILLMVQDLRIALADLTAARPVDLVGRPCRWWLGPYCSLPRCTAISS
jgi:hypothetical protein